MRRASLLVLPLLLPLSGGCTSDCGPIDQYNNRTYRVFANPVSYEVVSDKLLEGPEFWSYGIPANGAAEWVIRWGGAALGPVTVVINGQEFEGTGELEEVECGQARIDFSGVYLDSLSEVQHTFNASMALDRWDDGFGGSKLGAYLIWKESWSHPSSETGQFTARSHLTGDLIGQTSGTTQSPGPL